MEERELTRLLEQLGDRVTPGPPPLRRIVDDGEALRGRRSRRVRTFAVAAAAAAAVVGGGTLAATVIDLPSMTASSEDSAGGAGGDNAGSAGGGEQIEPEAAPGGGGDADEGATAADAVEPVLTVAPQVVAPGDTVEVASQDDVSGFGQAWRLERLTGDTWTWEYTLLWAGGNTPPTWWPAADERALEDNLIPYTAPFPLVIPPEAAPGDYRVCQNDGSRDLCGLLTVAG